MKYIVPAIIIIGGIACIIMDQAFAGVVLCICGAVMYEDALGSRE